jgi:hypothetical protein
MEFFWFLVMPFLVILAVLTIVDVVRHKEGWSIAGWTLLVIVLPVIGSLIYWLTRKSAPVDVEQAYLAEQDRHYQSAHKPIDRGF